MIKLDKPLVSWLISRQVIKSEFGIDTSRYENAYFGEHNYDPIYTNHEQFLLKGAKLLSDIQLANSRLMKIDNSALEHELKNQWRNYKRYVNLSGISSCFKNIEQNELERDINAYYKAIKSDARVILYGTGRHSTRFLQELTTPVAFTIVAFCDSDKGKHGTVFNGKPVISPEQIVDTDYDYIFIATPIYEDEIRYRLVCDLGISEERIYNLPDAIEFPIHFRKYDQLYSHVGNEKKVYMFCAPDYENLGDHAIAAAEQRFFFDKFNIEISEVPCRSYIKIAPIANKHIRPTDLILITGGGFLGSLWPFTEHQARETIRMYKDNKIIIMPQTLYWEDSPRLREERKDTQMVYADHPNLTFCARDRVTEKMARELYPSCNTILVPDMVLYNDWKDYFENSPKRKGTLLCLKKDKESVLSDECHDYLFALGERLCGTAFDGNTNIRNLVSFEERDVALKKKLKEFRSADLVITDRLHGLIFAAITETPCVALDNCNHKIRESFAWVGHLPYLRYADSIEKVETLAQQAILTTERKYSPLYYTKYFDKLADEIRRD